MDELRRHAAPFLDRWQRLARGQRIAIAAVLAASAVGFFFLVAEDPTDWRPVGDGREFNSKELAAIQSAWREQGLSNYRRDGRKLSVPASELARYEAALPKTDVGKVTSSNEWERQLAGVNIFTSHEELEQRKDNALRNEVRRVLKAIPAIAEADVIWARSRGRSAFASRSKVTATINVTPREGFDLTPELAQSLRAAVAGMIPDLIVDDVTILDQSTGLTITDDSVELLVGQQRRRQRERLARQLEARITTALAHIPNATVQAKLADPTPTRHMTAKPTFGSAIVWAVDSADNLVEFAPLINDDDEQEQPQLVNSEDSPAWQVAVQIPESYFEARAAQQLLSAQDRSANVTDLLEEECARLRQLVRNLLPSDATLAELSIVPTVASVTAAPQVASFTAWPHFACGLIAVFCLTFAARRRRTEDASPSMDRPTEYASPSAEALEVLTPHVEHEDVEVRTVLAPTIPLQPITDLARLQQLDPQWLADALRQERPQAIAVLLTRFPARLASACLSRFEPSLQTEVIRRLKSLGEVPDELVTEIARAVYERLAVPVDSMTYEPTNRIAHLLPEAPTPRAFT